MPKSTQAFGAELVPTSQVAEEAKVDVATVNRWARSGRIRVAVKGPGATGANLYFRSDVDALLSDEKASA